MFTAIKAPAGAVALRRQAGMSLVELMIAMLIALIGTVVIFQVFAVSEGLKRTTTSGGDAQQSGSFAAYTLERQVRLAGKGLDHMTNVWGCRLLAWRSGSAMVNPSNSAPLPTTEPVSGLTSSQAPYQGIYDPINSALAGQNLRLTPVLIVNGGATAASGAPDTIVIMAGQHQSIAVPTETTAAPGTTNKIALVNPVGISQSDLLLAVDQDTTSALSGQCRVAQATDAAGAPTLPDVVGVVPNPVNLASGISTGPDAFNGYSATTQVANLGPGPTLANPDAGPMFTVFALGSDGTTQNALLSYNLIQGGTPLSLADNVVNLQAVYGLAANSASAPITSWVPPTGAFSAATLMNGTTASRDNIGRIRAIRLAVVARSPELERSAVSDANFTIFSDLSAAEGQVSGTLTSAEQRYRYRTYDITIPLRNMLLMNNS